MSSEMNVIPEGPGSVSPRMKHRWTRERGRAGPSSTQWPGFSGVPWTDGSGFDSLGPMYATSRPRTSRYHSIAFCGSETTIEWYRDVLGLEDRKSTRLNSSH